jgi:hypothetical protein
LSFFPFQYAFSNAIASSVKLGMLEARFLLVVDIVVVAYPVIKIAFVPKPQHLMGKMTNI